MKYTATLILFKQFTAGNFAGLTTKDLIGFPDKATASRYLSDIESAIKAGKLDYKLTSYVLEAE
tara:strand:+ start:6148 stop:6339 length:192 start_codon:yes stop_codon:yes gene_type:complete